MEILVAQQSVTTNAAVRLRQGGAAILPQPGHPARCVRA
jgi:hypothetical protein